MIIVYYFTKICWKILWFFWFYVPRYFVCVVWEIIKNLFNLCYVFFGKKGMRIFLRVIQQIVSLVPMMGCCPSKPKTNNADSGPRFGFNTPSSSRPPIIEEQPRFQQRKPVHSQQTKNHRAKPGTYQSKPERLNSPPQRPNNNSDSPKIKLGNSGLSVFENSSRNNYNNTYNIPYLPQSPPRENRTDNNVPLPKAKALKVIEQNVHSVATKPADTVDKRRVGNSTIAKVTKESTVVDIEKAPSQRESSHDKRRQFLNDRMLQPKIQEQNVHNVASKPADSVDKRRVENSTIAKVTKESTVVDIEKAPSQRECSHDKRRQFLNERILQPKIKEQLSPLQGNLKGATNNGNQGQPMKANSSILNQLLTDDKQEHSYLLKFLMENGITPNKTISSEINDVGHPSYTNIYGAGHFEAKMPSMSYDSHTAARSTMQSHQNLPLSFNSHSYPSLKPPEKPKRSKVETHTDPSSNKLVADPSEKGKIENAIISNSEKGNPSRPHANVREGSSPGSLYDTNKLGEAGYKQFEETNSSRPHQNFSVESIPGYFYQTNKLDEGGSDNELHEASMEIPKQLFEERNSTRPFEGFSGKSLTGSSYQPTEKPNKLGETDYQLSSNKLVKASVEVLKQFEVRNSTGPPESFGGKTFSWTSYPATEKANNSGEAGYQISNEFEFEPNKSDEYAYQESNELDVGVMELDSDEKSLEAMEILPQQPEPSVPDNRNYVPTFRDYNEIDENDLIDDLTESKISSETYNQMIKMLKKVYEQAQPFHEKIDHFTELENSNSHYYIEESLRRCIDKLDDMFDDIGDVKALRDERKKVYKFVFPMFERLDAKVQENKLRNNNGHKEE